MTTTPVCVRVKVLVSPPPDTVIVPVRVAPGFDLKFTKIVPLPVPVVPVPKEAVNHDVSLLDIVHDVFDVTLMCIKPAFSGIVDDDVDNVSIGSTADPACVMGTSNVLPPAAIVIFPVRLAPVFAVTDIIRKSPTDPLGVLTISQDGALLDAVHFVGAEMSMMLSPADAVGFQNGGNTLIFPGLGLSNIFR